MATEKESAFPIEDFDGINRNSEREDMNPTQLYSTQNLWEKTLGTLETRGHSQAFTGTLPSGITDLGNIHKVYKSTYDRRFCAIQCTPQVEVLGALPTGVSLSFVTDADGYWNNDFSIGGTTFATAPRYIILRFVGYGWDKFYRIDRTSVTGYSAATNQLLRLTVSQAQDSHITGIEILAVCACGEVETPAAINNASSYNEKTLWVGFQELVSASTVTTDFLYCPITYDATMGTAGVTINAAERTFSLTTYNNSEGFVAGTLEAGRTYYMAILPQYMVFDANPASRASYRQVTVDFYGGDIVPFTIPGEVGTFGGCRISNVNPSTSAFLVAVGDSPRTLQPYKIFNDSLNLTEGYVLSSPRYNPGWIGMEWTSATEVTLGFNFSDFSRHDMFLGINDNGTHYPIFAGGVGKFGVYTDAWEDGFGWTTAPPSGLGRSLVYGSLNHATKLPKLGDGSTYHFVDEQDYALFTSSHNPVNMDNTAPAVITPGTLPAYIPGSWSSYWLCDGNVAAPCVEDYQASRIFLPPMKYIAKFDGSIFLCGGDITVDPANGLKNSAARRAYISRAGNPFDFTIAGAPSEIHNYLTVDEGEDLTGMGIYTNNTTNEGPLSQLVISSKGSLSILSRVPTYSDAGALTESTLKNLSRKVGCVGHSTFVNTPLGTIFCGVDDVYLLRAEGEPMPIGQNLYGLLRGADLSMARACYHDKHYKLSFYHSDYAGDADYNNVEVWLNISKMIAKKSEDWVGPMVGRSINYTFVEDRAGDGLSYNSARDRLCVDRENRRVFKADVEPAEADTAILDFASAVTSILETKDLPISQQDNNWNKLLMRSYWKLRTNKASGTPFSFTEVTHIDGIQVESKAVTASRTSSALFHTEPLQLVRVFPVGRLRGRTIRKKLSTTDRVAIAGFQVNYAVERRRI